MATGMPIPRLPWRNVEAREGPGGLVYIAIVQASYVRYHLGSWSDGREAAIAVDRASLHFGLGVALNVPEESRRRGPASPAELKVLARASRPKLRGASKYFGVAKLADGTARAQITVNGRSRNIARFRTERAAARLNFPNEGLPPATIDEIRREQEREVNARMRRKASSHFDGVSCDRRGCHAYVPLAGTNLRIATYDDERAAALAYDRAVLYLLGGNVQRNFPRRRVTPASPEQLRTERRAEVKQRCTSKYVGVSWSRRAQKWQAAISVGPRRECRAHHLGFFDDEEDAARAYDRALWRFRHERQRPVRFNFPAEYAERNLRGG
jgi:hypothetical protein